MSTSPLGRAISALGSQKRLADAAGVSQPSISKAVRTGRISAELALRVSKATGGIITAVDLRPDLFGDGKPKPRTWRRRKAAQTSAEARP